MIRPFTLITMLLAAGAGAYLFGVKHRAQVLDDQLAATAQQSRLDQQRIRVLQAQWALEIDPTRLSQLASEFTTLQPMKPSQLVTLAALRAALPPAGSVAPVPNPESPSLSVSSPDIASAAPAAKAMAALPLPPESAPSPPPMLASIGAPHIAAPHKVSHSVLHMASTKFAESLPPPRAVYAAAPPDVYQPPAVPPMRPQLVSDKASNTPPLDSGSMLGMAADLPPPQPLPPGGDNN